MSTAHYSIENKPPPHTPRTPTHTHSICCDSYFHKSTHNRYRSNLLGELAQDDEVSVKFRLSRSLSLEAGGGGPRPTRHGRFLVVSHPPRPKDSCPRTCDKMGVVSCFDRLYTCHMKGIDRILTLRNWRVFRGQVYTCGT